MSRDVGFRWLAGLTALILSAGALTAQQRELDALRDRLDGATFRAFTALIDSAHVAGVPTSPLISKVQEGLLKRASNTAILSASRGLLSRLQQARGALGASTATEIEAGASALRAGAAASQLAALRAARGAQGVTVPLVVLADLLARGVPLDTAARALQALASANATDAAFSTLRLNIERDITGGKSPAEAAGTRFRAILERHP